VRAVAPDAETAADGTTVTADNVTRDDAELRRQLPADVPILAKVPWPSEKRTGGYPDAEILAWIRMPSSLGLLVQSATRGR